MAEMQRELDAERRARDAAQKRAEVAEHARELARQELTAKMALAEAQAASKCACPPSAPPSPAWSLVTDTSADRHWQQKSRNTRACRFEAASRVVRSRFESRAAELGLEVDSWKSFVATQGLSGGFQPAHLPSLYGDGKVLPLPPDRVGSISQAPEGLAAAMRASVGIPSDVILRRTVTAP